MKIAILAAALAIPLCVPFAAAQPPAPARTAVAPPISGMPNTFGQNPACKPIRQQVAGELREYRGTRLDQQPPAQLLLAVDRQVNGCREVTFARGAQSGAPSR